MVGAMDRNQESSRSSRLARPLEAQRSGEAWWIIYPKGEAIWQQEIKHTNTGNGGQGDQDLIKDLEE